MVNTMADLPTQAASEIRRDHLGCLTFINGVLVNTLIDNTYRCCRFALGVNLNYPDPLTWDNC